MTQRERKLQQRREVANLEKQKSDKTKTNNTNDGYEMIGS